MSLKENLHHELDKIRQSLRVTDENIRKLTGREALENRFRSRESFGSLPSSKRQNTGNQGLWVPGRGQGNRYRESSNANVESGDEEDLPHKPVVQSSVVATQKDSKSRQDIIEQQNNDESGKARNRRMFGVLIGTLQQFRVEEKQKEQQEQKRRAVEQKLEDKQKEEKEMLKKEKQQLINDKKEKQQKLRQLENKIELVKLHEEWEEQLRTQMYFVRTDTKPYIFYLPKSHTEASCKKHEQTKATLEAIIGKHRKQLEEEIDEGSRNDAEDDDQIKQKKYRHRETISKQRTDEEHKMEMSDLDEDTGVNVDYEASGDEEKKTPAASVKQSEAKTKNRSPGKRQKSRHSHDYFDRNDKDGSKQFRYHSSKQTNRRDSKHADEKLNTSSTGESITVKNDRHEKMDVDDGEISKHREDEFAESKKSPDEQNTRYNVDISCATTAEADGDLDASKDYDNQDDVDVNISIQDQ